MAKEIESVSFRKVGDKGFITNTNTITSKGTKNEKFNSKEEIFLSKETLMEFLNKTVKKI